MRFVVYIICCNSLYLSIYVSGDRYLIAGTTDGTDRYQRYKILHDVSQCPVSVFSPFGGGSPRESEILGLNFGH